MLHRIHKSSALLALLAGPLPAQDTTPGWLAGDHHIHSRFSYGWDREENPPAPILGGDAIYPTPMNALMARHYGLDWIVTTDHGGPNHSRLNMDEAYPELLRSREVLPDLVQFYGMEFDTPGADHSSIVMPQTRDEARLLFDIESQFSRNEPWPANPEWNQEPRMLDALRVMDGFAEKPLVFAHHPSRSATGEGEYGLYTPQELRAWNDTAPEVAVGMEGAPGHQATALAPDGGIRRQPAPRGYYRHPTLGGFDQMTAIVGGFWDSMLAEGRDWWITATSDSHINFTEGGGDFWPGQYSKTYVWAEKTPASILAGLRAGRIFATTGDLVRALDFSVRHGDDSAMTGGNLHVPAGSDVAIDILFHDPQEPNHYGENPEVRRVDMIMGEITGPAADPAADRNPTARVLARFTEEHWRRNGAYLEISHTLENVSTDLYLRIRGTNTEELEPGYDATGDNPWHDLWFYSNPIRIRIQQRNL